MKPARREHRRGKKLLEPLDLVIVRAPLLPVESYKAVKSASCVDFTGAQNIGPSDVRARRALAVGSPNLLKMLDRTAPGESLLHR